MFLTYFRPVQYLLVTCSFTVLHLLIACPLHVVLLYGDYYLYNVYLYIYNLISVNGSGNGTIGDQSDRGSDRSDSDSESVRRNQQFVDVAGSDRTDSGSDTGSEIDSGSDSANSFVHFDEEVNR
jgi:hypothetical protein